MTRSSKTTEETKVKCSAAATSLSELVTEGRKHTERFYMGATMTAFLMATLWHQCPNTYSHLAYYHLSLLSLNLFSITTILEYYKTIYKYAFHRYTRSSVI